MRRASKVCRRRWPLKDLSRDLEALKMPTHLFEVDGP